MLKLHTPRARLRVYQLNRRSRHIGCTDSHRPRGIEYRTREVVSFVLSEMGDMRAVRTAASQESSLGRVNRMPVMTPRYDRGGDHATLSLQACQWCHDPDG